MPLISKKTALLLSSLFLGACLQAPDDTNSLKSMTQNHMFLTTKDYSISRSVGAVNKSLRAGAEKCFQRVAGTTIYGRYGAAGNFATKYTYTYKNTANGAQLALHGKMIDKSWNVVNVDKNGGFMFMAESSAASGATKLRLYTPKFGSKDLNSKVVGWANGDHLYCPNF